MTKRFATPVQPRWLGAGLLVLAAAAGAQPAADAPANPVLQRELLDMREVDQAALRDKTIDPAALRRLQQANTARLKDIVQRHGWPTLGMVGNDAAQGAWLIVQHADEDRAWQRQALGLMEALVAEGEVRKSDVAYLRDRLDMAQTGRQRYGTQGHCVAKDVWEPFATVDPERLDERRNAMDMGTEAAYRKRAGVMCANFKGQ